MTIASTTIRADYAGNNTTGPFGFTFSVPSLSVLEVIQTDLNGNDTILAVTSDYTAVGVKAPADYTQGANITLVNVIPTGYHLAIVANLDGTQSTDVKENQRYYAYVHEQEFDLLATKDLQQQQQLNKSIKAPDSEPAGTANLNLPHVAQRANMYPAFDASGNLIMVQNLTGTTLNSYLAGMNTSALSQQSFYSYIQLPFYQTNFTPSGSNNDFDPGSVTVAVMFMTPSNATTLTGIKAYGFQNQRLTIFNASATYSITLKYANVSSGANNRIYGNGGSDYVISPLTAIDLVYMQNVAGGGSMGWVIV